MPPRPAPTAADGAGGQGQQQQRGPMQNLLGGLFRAVVMWYMMRQFLGNKTAPAPGTPGVPGAPAPRVLSPRLLRGTPVDVHFYISEAPDWKNAVASSSPPVWVAQNVELGLTNGLKHTVLYRPSEAVQQNGTVYVHTVFTPPGASAQPGDEHFDRVATFGSSRQLNAYYKKRSAREGINLLSGKNSTDGAPLPDDMSHSNETVVISYLKPNVTVTMVDDFASFPSHQIPPQYKGIIEFDATTNTYSPHVWFNEFWLLRDYLVPVNKTVTELPIHLEVSSMPGWKFTLFSQMDQSLSMQQTWGAMADGETDEVKRIFLEGNPYFLGLTMIVSLLHSIFDMFAFKNDIRFWKDNKSMEGLSARTVLINCFSQAVIFLYLLDSGETSMVVLLSSGVGTAIEFWKVTKAMSVSLHFPPGARLPRLRLADRDSYKKSKTNEYDAEAMRYLSYALYPLVAGYAIYSLIYKTHRSWYSWVLNSLVGAVYTFGFILMCPQLYLNYKLKSVAHLPWRQMTFKFLNTIIDDLFAFVIKMPLLHRLSVFRDDVVFLVFLYQRWIYRVDYKRRNEFGYSEEQPEAEGEAEQSEDGKEKKKKPLLIRDEKAEEEEEQQPVAGSSAAAAAVKEEESKKEK